MSSAVFIPVVIGFGHCGRALHLRCLRAMMAGASGALISADVHLVDPRREATEQKPALHSHDRLPPAAAITGGVPVVHVCTPPHAHLACVREALALGYRFIILEKPMAPTLEDALAIRALALAAQAVVLVVAVWLNSPLTRRILSRLAEPGVSGLAELDIVHNKSRFSRSLARELEHVFDIEMPHQLSLACALTQGRPQLLSAHASDLVLNGQRRANMAHGEIALASACGMVARLVSNLNHPSRERSVVAKLRDGRRWVGFFPVGADDSFSQLFEYSAADTLTHHEVFDDDPLSACLTRCYQHVAACVAGARPSVPLGMSLGFNVNVVALLDEAKRKVAANGIPHGAPRRVAVVAA